MDYEPLEDPFQGSEREKQELRRHLEFKGEYELAESDNLAFTHPDVQSYGSNGQHIPIAFADEKKEVDDIGTYPPGFAETGSRNLPVLEVNPTLMPYSENPTQKKQRRKKRRNRVEEIKTPNESQTSDRNSGNNSDTPSELGVNPDKQANGSLQTNKSPAVLPPIKFKSAANTVGSALTMGSGKTWTEDFTKSEEPLKSMDGESDKKKGLANQSYESNEGNDEYKYQDIDSFFYKKDETLCFQDGIRKIDYIFAYKEDEESKEDEDEQEKTRIRDSFHENLKKTGVELEVEPREMSQDQKTCFVKVHVPWPVLVTYAERMKVKMPLKIEKEEEENLEDECCDCSWFDRLKTKLTRPFRLNNDLIKEKFGDQDYYTADFTKDKQQYFDIRDEATFFTNPERSRIAHRIMDETRYGGSRKHIGIDRLLLDGIYIAAYPLHDGNVDKKDPKVDNMRELLHQEWARWGRWYKFQPLDAIRFYLSDKIGLYFAFLEFYVMALIAPSLIGLIVIIYGGATTYFTKFRAYLGDKTGLYFAWLGFYTKMLLIPTLVGLVVFIYSLATLWTYPPTQEVCNQNDPNYVGNVTMCPLCDYDCSYYKLGTSCTALQITYVFDNESTIFFAIFMSLWATMFLEFWKRRQFELTYKWDLVNYDEDRDLVRPEYEALVERERFNPATGRMETYMDPGDRITRTGFSIVTVVFWVCVIIAAVFAVIVYRVIMHTVFATSVDLSSLGAVADVASPSLLTTITASLISIVIIMILNKVYEKIAIRLTNWEIPRTRIDFEDSLTMKIFCFQFVNYYSYLFYIAFFKSSFTGRPGNYNYLFGEWRWEGCDSGGCMYELSIQLITIMLAKQILNNAMELLLPWAFNKYRQYKSRKAVLEDNNKYTRWEKDFDLASVNLDLFYEYLEMIIQFGFVTLFVCAFPLAPVLALLNNIVEIRLDAIKFIFEFRRPLAVKCSDIGAWFYILEIIGVLSVVTNAFTIAVTSETIPKLVYFYVYADDTFGRNTYEGYVNNSLSFFNVSDFDPRSVPRRPNPFADENVTECRYLDYRSPPSANPPYEHTLQYWHVIAARLAFVIVMEHVVFFLKRFLDYVIPDRPKKLNAQIKREHYLVQNMLFEAEKEQLVEQFAKESKVSSSTADPSNGTEISYVNEKKTTAM